MEKEMKGPNVMFQGQNLNQQRMALFKGLTAKANKAENLNMQALHVKERDFDAPKPRSDGDAEVNPVEEDSEFNIEEEEKEMEEDEEKAKDLEKEKKIMDELDAINEDSEAPDAAQIDAEPAIDMKRILELEGDEPSEENAHEDMVEVANEEQSESENEEEKEEEEKKQTPDDVLNQMKVDGEQNISDR